MTESEDIVNEFLEALRTGKGNPRFVELGRAYQEAQAKRRGPDELEVRTWLASNDSTVPLAVNHFNNRAEVEAFVNGLYSLGAPRVTACNISYEAEDARQSKSNSLEVTLPNEKESREQIIELCNKHCCEGSADGTPFKDEGQATLALWWD